MREVVLNNTEMFMYGARPGWPRPLRARMADNACALAKFGRPKNACVFEGGRIWLSPHGRARLRAQLARAKPGGGSEVGRRSAYALVICWPAPPSGRAILNLIR